MTPDFTPGEPDTWTWPDAYDRDDDVCPHCCCWPCACGEDEEGCPYCGGEGFVFGSDGVGIECPEC